MSLPSATGGWRRRWWWRSRSSGQTMSFSPSSFPICLLPFFLFSGFSLSSFLFFFSFFVLSVFIRFLFVSPFDPLFVCLIWLSLQSRLRKRNRNSLAKSVSSFSCFHLHLLFSLCPLVSRFSLCLCSPSLFFFLSARSVCPFSCIYKARECPLFVPLDDEGCSFLFEKKQVTNSPAIAGLLVTTYLKMHRVGERDSGQLIGRRRGPRQVLLQFFFLPAESVGWRRRWWTMIFKTVLFSRLKWLFSICPPKVLTFSNWTLIHGNLCFCFFNFAPGSIAQVNRLVLTQTGQLWRHK